MDAFSEIIKPFLHTDIKEFFVSTCSSFALISAAEMGDKSQLMCVMLASRYRTLPVISGASAAFLFLNSLAVIFGTAIANWLPDYIVAACIALLFIVFGLHALWQDDGEDDPSLPEKSNHNIFFSTFLLITVAEFGDKTQLAVVALSSTAQPLAIWLGSSLALISGAMLGIVAGRKFLQKIPLSLLHKMSGGIFLLLACVAVYKTYTGLLEAKLLSAWLF
ncbi:TMEM165/GDT1 family protein [Methylomonas sp. AM2-LC]|uniref:TMEM165/GDT1 family protein n=1 Tax=Methylomonas sp. AM2-LC TaxID=3153301 RepID=UPI0032630D63